MAYYYSRDFTSIGTTYAKEPVDNLNLSTMNFKIKKGSHYSNRWLHKALNFLSISDRLEMRVTITDSMLYGDHTDDKYDVNKLFGFSRGNHKKNSYRVGWNCVDGNISLYAYCHIEGVMKFAKLCDNVRVNDVYDIVINLYPSYVHFNATQVIGDIILFKAHMSVAKPQNKWSIGYNLFPYFGGDKTAPKDVCVNLEKQ